MRLLLTSLCFSLIFTTHAFELPKLWEGDLISKIGLPSTRLRDEASLFNWTYRLELNQYLKKVNEQMDVDWEIIIIESLEGRNLDKVVEQNMAVRGYKAALFFLSLSDRKFKLTYSNELTQRLGEEKVQEIVSMIIPSLAKSEHQQALFLLLEASSFALDPSFKVSPPLPSLRKFRNLKGFTYFLLAFLFVFLLGHKLFSRSKAVSIFNNNADSDSKSQLFHHALFLKSKSGLPRDLLESFEQRLSELQERRGITVSHYHASSSDHYPAAHFRSSLALSILALTLLYFFPLEWRDPIYVLAVFAQALIIGYLLAFFSRIKRFFTSKAEMKEETFQLLIETLAKDSGLLERPSLIMSYSKLENKIDFVFSTALIKKMTEAHIKDIKHFFKNNSSLLRSKSTDFPLFINNLISFIEHKSQLEASEMTTELLTAPSSAPALAQDSAPEPVIETPVTEIKETNDDNNELIAETKIEAVNEVISSAPSSEDNDPSASKGEISDDEKPVSS